MKNEINVSTESGVRQLIILEGKAPDPVNPIAVEIKGNIHAVRNFLIKRKDSINLLTCFLIVSLKNMWINLIVEENSPTGTEVTGTLVQNSCFNELEINKDKTFDTHTLAAMLQKKVHLFESKNVGKEIISSLKQFKAKVDKQLENTKDNRGNVAMSRVQAIESNIPAGFTLSVPLFEGVEEKVGIFVEIVINPDTLNCSLVSNDLYELLDVKSKEFINSEVQEIEKLAPELVIIHSA